MTPCNALCHMSLWRRTCLFCARGAVALGACALALRLCLGLRLLPHAMITDNICDTWVTWGAPGRALVQVHRVKLACIWSCLSIRVVLELFCPHHAGVCVCMHTLREPICNGVEIDNLTSLQLAVFSLSGETVPFMCYGDVRPLGPLRGLLLRRTIPQGHMVLRPGRPSAPLCPCLDLSCYLLCYFVDERSRRNVLCGFF